MSSERKVAVITGASRGIGAALADAYRDLDYAVVATARAAGVPKAQIHQERFAW